MIGEHVISNTALAEINRALLEGNRWLLYNTAAYFLDNHDVYMFDSKDKALEFSESNISEFDRYSVIRVLALNDVLRQIPYGNQISDLLEEQRTNQKISFATKHKFYDQWLHTELQNQRHSSLSKLNTNYSKNKIMMSYKKFSLMIAISLIIMYTVMFLNVVEIKHYPTSLTRIYMAVLMAAPMAIVMMMMMGKMYPNKKINMGITVSSVVVFIVTLIALRSQTSISDVQYMKAMIPHHSPS